MLNNKIIHSYRVEMAMKTYIIQDINLQKEELVYKDIICAIDIHRKAMQLVSVL